MFSPFGLDIGEKSIKAVAGKIRSGRFVVNSAGQVILPPGVIVNGEIKNPDKLQEIILALLRQAKPEPIRSRVAIVSLPESKVYLHVTTVPQASPEKTSEMIKWDLASHVSEDIEQMDWDWEAGQASAGQRPALAAAITKAWAQTYYQVFAKIGLKVFAFDMEAKALVRMLPEQIRPDQRVMLVDISARHATFSVYSQGLIQFVSSYKRGGDDWTELIARTLQVTPEKAREIKHSLAGPADTQNQELKNLLLQEANQLADEIERTRDFYLNREDHPGDVEKIILVGGAAQLPSLAKFLGEKLSLPVLTGQPEAILDPGSQKLLAGAALSYGTALGLAIRGQSRDPVLGELNLVAQEKQEAEVTRPQKRRIKALTVWVILATLALLAAYVVMGVYLRWRTDNLDRDLKNLQAGKTDGQVAMEQQVRKYNAYQSAYQDIKSNEYQWSQLVTDIDQLAAGKITVTKLSISDQRQGRLIGQAGTREDIVNFQEQLRQDPQIESVNNPLSNFSVNENSRIDFEITFVIKKK